MAIKKKHIDHELKKCIRFFREHLLNIVTISHILKHFLEDFCEQSHKIKVKLLENKTYFKNN